MSLNARSMAIIGWVGLSLFYFFQYVLRVFPGVAFDELRHAFNMTAENFSMLGSWYLYAYSCVQIPVGFLLDRIGVRKTMFLSLSLCLFGWLLLPFISVSSGAYLSRFLVGLGSSSAFISCLKWCADYFPQGIRGFFMGGSLAIGMTGALVSGYPVVVLLNNFGWRNTVFIVSLFGIALFLYGIFCIPSPSKMGRHFKDEEEENIISSVMPSSRGFMTFLKAIPNHFKNIVSVPIIAYSVFACGMYAPMSIFGDIWGVSFIVTKMHIDRSIAVSLVMLIYVGMAVGSLIFPYIAEKYNIHLRIIQIFSFLQCLGLMFLLEGPVLDVTGLACLIFITGVFSGGEMVCFSAGLLSVSKKFNGSASGFMNTMNMLASAIFLQFVGWILDKIWHGAQDASGLKIYTVEEYGVAMWVVVLLSAGTFVLSLLYNIYVRYQRSQNRFIV